MNEVDGKTGSTLFLIYDLESTGFDVCKDRIVQICILVLLQHTNSDNSFSSSSSSSPPPKFEQLLEFSSYVNPVDKQMSRGAAKVTGLTTIGPKGKTLRSAPFFKQVFVNRFLPQYKKETRHLEIRQVLLTGHNSKRYDDLLLLSELRRAGIGARRSLGTNNVKCVDTLCLARTLQKTMGKTVLPRLKLGELYKHFTGGKLEGAHDALADCRATLLILDKLWDGKKPLDYVTLQSQEALLHKQRVKKGLVTSIRFNNNSRKNRKIDSMKISQVQDRKSIVKCDHCGCMRSIYFEHCSHCASE